MDDLFEALIENYKRGFEDETLEKVLMASQKGLIPCENQEEVFKKGNLYGEVFGEEYNFELGHNGNLNVIKYEKKDLK